MARRLGSRLRIPILYYHEIGPERSRHVVHPDDFAAHVQWLVDAGFEALSLDAVAEIYGGLRPVPRRPVAITFDDGRRGVLRHAAPLLARHGLAATCYVVTDWLDGRGIPDPERYSAFLAWSDLEDLIAAGVEVGSHTASHRNLKKLPPLEVEREVAGSRKRLEDRLARPVLHFSFPKGRCTRVALGAVRRAGYRTAAATGERWNGRLARLHRLARLRVDGLSARGGLAGLLGK